MASLPLTMTSSFYGHYYSLTHCLGTLSQGDFSSQALALYSLQATPASVPTLRPPRTRLLRLDRMSATPLLQPSKSLLAPPLHPWSLPTATPPEDHTASRLTSESLNSARARMARISPSTSPRATPTATGFASGLSASTATHIYALLMANAE